MVKTEVPSLRGLGGRSIGLFGMVLMLATYLPVRAGWGASSSAPLARLVQAAKAEAVLNVTWAGAMGGRDAVKPLEEALNQKYGLSIKIAHTVGPTMPQVAARIIQEARAGRKASFDIFIGSETHPPMLIEADVLEAVPWADFFPYIIPEMQEFGGRVLRVSTGFRGLIYNTKLVRPDEVPRKMEDVFRPKWKGKIASTVYAAQFDSLALFQNVDETRAIVRKTAEWAGGLIRCPDEERIISGEFVLLFFACNDATTQILKAQGAPIDYALLEDALMVGFNYIGIPKNSEHPNLGKLFSGFVLSREGQAILDRFGYGLHLVPGTSKYQRYKAISDRGLKFHEISATKTMAKGAELEKLREEFQQILQHK